MKSFLILLFSPALFFLFYDILFYWVPISKNSYDALDSYLYIIIINDIVCMLSIVFCVFYYSKHYKRNHKPVVKYKRTPIAYHFLLVLASFIFFSYLVVSVFGTLDYTLVLSNNSQLYIQSKRGTAWVFVLFYAMIFVFIYDLYRYGPEKTRLILFSVLIIIVGSTGGRSIIIVFASFYLYIMIVKWNIKVSLVKITLLATVFVIFFFGFAIMRAKSLDTYLSVSSRLDFNNAFVFNDTINYLNYNKVERLVSLEDFYNYYLPRSLNPNKPISTAETRLIYPEVASRGTNYTFGIYSNIIINLGVFGLVLVPLFIFFSNFFFYYVSLSKDRSWLSFYLLFSLFYFMQFVRGGIINARFLTILTPLVIAFLIFNFARIKKS